jgi:hypothetical protein
MGSKVFSPHAQPPRVHVQTLQETEGFSWYTCLTMESNTPMYRDFPFGEGTVREQPVLDCNGRIIYAGDRVRIVKIQSVCPSDFLGREYEVFFDAKNNRYEMRNIAYRKEKYRETCALAWYGGESCEVLQK